MTYVHEHVILRNNMRGDILLKLGENDAARKSYETALQESKNLVASFPSNMLYLSILAHCYERIGSFYASLASSQVLSDDLRKQNWANAKQWYQESLRIWTDWGNKPISCSYDTGKRNHVDLLIKNCEKFL